MEGLNSTGALDSTAAQRLTVALDSTAGKLYIASRTDGKILQVNVGQ